MAVGKQAEAPGILKRRARDTMGAGQQQQTGGNSGVRDAMYNSVMTDGAVE